MRSSFLSPSKSPMYHSFSWNLPLVSATGLAKLLPFESNTCARPVGVVARIMSYFFFPSGSIPLKLPTYQPFEAVPKLAEVHPGNCGSRSPTNRKPSERNICAPDPVPHSGRVEGQYRKMSSFASPLKSPTYQPLGA